MLPDFPKIKQEIHTLFMNALYLMDAQMAPLSGGIPRRRYHEGKGGTLFRADGSTDTTDPQSFKSETTYTLEELGKISLKEVFERIQETVSDLARQREKFFMEQMKEIVESTGNDIDAGGRSMNPDLLLEVFENIQIDFDKNNNPIWPSIILAPEMAEKMETVLKQFQEEPYAEKRKVLIEKKRLEWYDRESNRKLVD